VREIFFSDLLNCIGNFPVTPDDNFNIRYVRDRPDDLSQNEILFCRKEEDKLKLDSIKTHLPCAILVQEPGLERIEKKDRFTLVIVHDIEAAYWKFVKYYRSLFTLPVVGVTGTCGKSTTKEMLKHIFSETHVVQATKSSNNSNRLNLGYLLGIDDRTGVGIFEFGVMFEDDIINYSRYFEPTVGIITNISLDHLRFINTFDQYVKAKGRILEGLKYQGTLILNSDDENIRKIDLAPYQGKVIYYGQSEKANFRAVNIHYGINGMVFELYVNNEIHELFVPGYGEHNVYNALAAIAGANANGISVEAAGQIIRTFRPMDSHLQLHKGINGCLVIDDTFSSNPKSNEVALKVLNHLGQGRTKVAVLGRMSSMVGPMNTEKQEYQAIGQKVVALDIDYLLTNGPKACIIGQTALDEGMREDKVYLCDEPEEVVANLRNILDDTCIVLFKTCWGEDFSTILEKILVQSGRRPPII
jgi:UDP-N-acetylmuramoyl-tripeptide--D-alanyl-D-alanine ligase